MTETHDYDLVTRRRQRGTLQDVLAGYRRMGIPAKWEEKSIPLHSLIATQDAIEKAKYERVLELVEKEDLKVPILVEEHYARGQKIRYLIDGHCRTRALLQLAPLFFTAFVIWSPAGEFDSNFVRIAGEYGDVLVKDLPFC